MKNILNNLLSISVVLLMFTLFTMQVHAQVPPAGNIMVLCRIGALSVCAPPPATYTISGNVFVDLNRNGTLDVGESNYAATPTITTSAGTVTANANGSYVISNIPAGAVTVKYNSLPANYYLTSPLNGPPPQFSVTVGTPGCSTNAAPGALCNAGNITGLNFGITNIYPWFQITCGDLQEGNGIVDNLPPGQPAANSSTSCSGPGFAFTSDSNASFGQGQTPPIVVGGSSYPEVYSVNSVLDTSYTALIAKAQAASITPTDLSTYCTLTNCTLPANLPHGLYIAKSDVTIVNANYTFQNNLDYVFLINGNLTFSGNITVQNGSTALFATTKDIVVSANVGTIATSPTSNLDGWLIAGQNFIVNSQGNCTDLRLNIGGAIIANAMGSGGTFQNDRDLCGNDVADPTVTVAQRLDMILNAPQFLRQQQTISQELAP